MSSEPTKQDGAGEGGNPHQEEHDSQTVLVRTPEEEAELVAKKAEEEEAAAKQKQADDEETARLEAEAEEEAARKQAEEEAALAAFQEEQRAARESAEEEEATASTELRDEEAAEYKSFNADMKGEAIAIAAKKEEEAALQVKVDERRAEIERLREIVAAGNAERVRVNNSRSQVAEQERALDAAVLKHDELEAQRYSLNALLEIVGDREELRASVDELEQKVASESLQHVWEESVKEDDLAKADVTTLNINDLTARIEQCATQQENWVHRANELLTKSEQEKNLTELDVTNTIADVNKSFESEKKAMMSTRKQLKALETEQHYHIRRGTYIKDPQSNAPKDKDFDGDRETDQHDHCCAEIVEERERMHILIEDVRGLKKDLEGVRKVAYEQTEEIQVQIDEEKAIAEEMEWERELLSLEQEDLASVKKELIAVTAAVKHQRK